MPDFGIVQFMPVETCVDPTRGLREIQFDSLFHEFTEDPAERPPGDWPRVSIAIRRQGLFVIEAAAPSFTRIMLRFCPERPDAGDYEIHPRGRGTVEKGRTTKITPVRDGDISYPMLAQFLTRYRVLTVGSERPHRRLVWLVGLKDVPTFDEADETSEGAA